MFDSCGLKHSFWDFPISRVPTGDAKLSGPCSVNLGFKRKLSVLSKIELHETTLLSSSYRNEIDSFPTELKSQLPSQLYLAFMGHKF